MRFNWLIVLTLMSSIAWATTYDSLRTERRGDQLVVIHQVDPGETLFSIGRRYSSEIDEIIRVNNIENNNIRTGQILEIPIELTKETPKNQNESKNIKSGTEVHIVEAGETLFAIGRKYGVKASEIMEWNNLTDESLNIGQKLSISQAAKVVATEKKELILPFDRALRHYVQSGENLQQISEKRKVSEDSLRIWNNLRNNDIKIGQILWYRIYDRTNEPIAKEIFGKHTVEGIAMQINDMEETDKYLALHKELPTGTLLEIRNLMNNKKVYVRVVGQLPSTGVNQDILLRLTPISFKRLGILDARARVELIYYDE